MYQWGEVYGMLIAREDFWGRWLIDTKSLLIKKIAILPRAGDSISSRDEWTAYRPQI